VPAAAGRGSSGEELLDPLMGEAEQFGDVSGRLLVRTRRGSLARWSVGGYRWRPTLDLGCDEDEPGTDPVPIRENEGSAPGGGRLVNPTTATRPVLPDI